MDVAVVIRTLLQPRSRCRDVARRVDDDFTSSSSARAGSKALPVDILPVKRTRESPAHVDFTGGPMKFESLYELPARTS